jgi:predicted lactoylglutathione lyase
MRLDPSDQRLGALRSTPSRRENRMPTPNMIFLNLPVADLDRSKAFYEALGYSCNAQFSDDKAAAVEISPAIVAMLQTKEHFATFTSKEIVDAHTTAEGLFVLGVSSRDEVDELADKALAAGGSAAGDGADLGFLYRRAFQDPDGHHWEALFMDMGGAPSQPKG